jgi:alpha 1,3-glucosidase
MLLSSGLAGIAFIGADVGGFFGNPSSELLIRWYQAGAYQPFFRAHAHIDSKRREPWLYGEEPLRLIRDSVVARYALLPYIYTLFYQASVDLLPVMRPLFVEYPTDPNTFKIQDSFLLGSDLLVTPVTKEGATSVNVYLPRGAWYDVYTHQREFGGKTISVNAPLDKIPVFQRGGSIIPRKIRVRRSSVQMEVDPITLFIALDGKNGATGELYLDDGKTYDYKSGKYAYRKITYSQQGQKALIESNPAEYGTNESVIIGGNYDAPNALERIVILGMTTKPTKVTLMVDDDSTKVTDLSFEFDETKEQTLTVKKPDCPVTKKWKVIIEGW